MHLLEKLQRHSYTVVIVKALYHLAWSGTLCLCKLVAGGLFNGLWIGNGGVATGIEAASIVGQTLLP